MHDEELGTSGIWNHGARHRENASAVLQTVFKSILREFAPYAVAGPSRSSAVRTSSLNHESFDYAVKAETIIVSFLDKADKVIYRVGCKFGV